MKVSHHSIFTIFGTRSGYRFFSFPGCYFIVLLLALNVTNHCYSQQAPANIGFETGTFSGWQGATGQCCPVYTPTSGIDTTRHAITSGNFTDPYSGGIVPVTAPGSLFSARLGNNSGSAESENLEYTFTVPSDSLLLILRFAVILENGIHPPVKQSRFRYEITGSSSLLEGCLSEQITAGDTSINFIINGAYEILNWQTRTVNLTGMQGTTISIHFETGDCEPGGHFGYAYVDGDLKPAKITGTLCNPDGSITLYAPEGLNGTWFDGSTTDSIDITVPLAGIPYTFDVGHENGCIVSLIKILDNIFPESNFSVTAGCNFETTFQNNSVCSPGSVYLWEFGDGQSQNQLNAAHNYNAPGIYEVSLTVQQTDNCKSVKSATVSVEESVKAEFSVAGNCINQPVTFENSSISATGSLLNYSWFIDNLLCYSSTAPEHIFYQPGVHAILLVATDLSGCLDTASAPITIRDTDDCNTELSGPWLPNAFTPNGDGINDFFEATTDKTTGQIPITIFDRNGEAVYSGNKWDGSLNGIGCPAGVYSFRLKTLYPSPEKILTGTVILIR